jgi:hypothetical protein
MVVNRSSNYLYRYHSAYLPEALIAVIWKTERSCDKFTQTRNTAAGKTGVGLAVQLKDSRAVFSGRQPASCARDDEIPRSRQRGAQAMTFNMTTEKNRKGLSHDFQEPALTGRQMEVQAETDFRFAAHFRGRFQSQWAFQENEFFDTSMSIFGPRRLRAKWKSVPLQICSVHFYETSIMWRTVVAGCRMADSPLNVRTSFWRTAAVDKNEGQTIFMQWTDMFEMPICVLKSRPHICL